jgi:ribosome maturation factor RimP
MDKSKIESTVFNWLEDKEIFLVEVIVSADNRIRVYIDSFDGVSIEKCVELSRHLNSAFDREEEDYDLEVSSPGLDMPFKVKEQYQKNLNTEISIVLADGKKYKGILTAFDDEGIEADVKLKVKADNQKKKKEIIEKQIFKFNDIKAVKSVVSFK